MIDALYIDEPLESWESILEELKQTKAELKRVKKILSDIVTGTNQKELTHMENVIFDMIKIRDKSNPISAREIARIIFEYSDVDEINRVTTHICKMRKKITKLGVIKVAYTEGYYFVPKEDS